MPYSNAHPPVEDLTMKASELFVHCLENEGVEYIFGLPGEENIDVMDALGSSIRILI